MLQLSTASSKILMTLFRVHKYKSLARSTMEHIFPDYYNKFHCIADRCTITCCQEWKITVDDDTNRKWKKILPPDTISDKRKNLTAYTCKKDGARVIGLDQNHRCPFLSQDKLCHLVTSYGDSVLSETCTLFPREIHEFSTHTEASLMPCHAARLLLTCGAKKILNFQQSLRSWIIHLQCF